MAAPAAAPVDVIARRVEALRSLRFTPAPGAGHGRARGRRSGRGSPTSTATIRPRGAGPTRRSTSCSGCIEPDEDLREISRSLFGEGVAGYYDPRATGACGWSRAPAPAPACSRRWCSPTSSPTRSRTSASASRPSRRRPTTASSRAPRCTRGARPRSCPRTCRSTSAPRRRSAGCSGSAFEDTGDLPPFLAGAAAVRVPGRRALRGRPAASAAGGGWTLVDTAFRLRLPASTEQVLHPRAYFSADEPRRVRLRARAVLGAAGRAPAPAPGASCRRASCCGSADAAAGWGGDRYELWRSGGVERPRHALAVGHACATRPSSPSGCASGRRRRPGAAVVRRGGARHARGRPRASWRGGWPRARDGVLSDVMDEQRRTPRARVELQCTLRRRSRLADLRPHRRPRSGRHVRVHLAAAGHRRGAPVRGPAAHRRAAAACCARRATTPTRCASRGSTSRRCEELRRLVAA